MKRKVTDMEILNSLELRLTTPPIREMCEKLGFSSTRALVTRLHSLVKKGQVKKIGRKYFRITDTEKFDTSGTHWLLISP